VDNLGRRVESDPQANSRNSTGNVLNKHLSSDGPFAFARLRWHRLVATGYVNERKIAESLSEHSGGQSGSRVRPI